VVGNAPARCVISVPVSDMSHINQRGNCRNGLETLQTRPGHWRGSYPDVRRDLPLRRELCAPEASIESSAQPAFQAGSSFQIGVSRGRRTGRSHFSQLAKMAGNRRRIRSCRDLTTGFGHAGTHRHPLVDVRSWPHNGLKSDIAPSPRCANRRHRACGELWRKNHTRMKSRG
jgi:hypothetical protein